MAYQTSDDVNQRRESNIIGNKIIFKIFFVFWYARTKNKMKFSKGTYKTACRLQQSVEKYRKDKT